MARARALGGDLSSEIQDAWDALARSLPEPQLEAAIRSGSVDRLFSSLLDPERVAGAFGGVRDRIRRGVANAINYFKRDLPTAARVGVAFDHLAPTVVTAIRGLQTRVIQGLTEDMRAAVRQEVEVALRAGANPREAARVLRRVLSLAPNQAEAVRNFEAMLKAGDREALTRVLRDRRFDSTLERALGAEGDGLEAGQIEKMVDAYRRRMEAYNAETQARTAALDAQKLAQRLTWDDAVRAGTVDGSELLKRWSGVLDDRERESHLEMEGEVVPWNEPFSNGQMIPGEDEYNCRCIAVYFLAPAA